MTSMMTSAPPSSSSHRYVDIFHYHLHTVVMSLSWFDMRKHVMHSYVSDTGHEGYDLRNLSVFLMVCG